MPQIISQLACCLYCVCIRYIFINLGLGIFDSGDTERHKLAAAVEVAVLVALRTGSVVLASHETSHLACTAIAIGHNNRLEHKVSY